MSKKMTEKVIECAKFNLEKSKALELLRPIDSLDSNEVLYVGFFDKGRALEKHLSSLSEEDRRKTIWEMIVANAYQRMGMTFRESYLSLRFKEIAKVLRSYDYKNNAYYRDIKFDKDIQIGRYLLTQESFLSGEIMAYDIGDMIEYNTCIPKFGIWEDRFDYPVLGEGENVWMAIAPNEIHTMEEPIEHAHGKVLTFGLGLGYFAYMASLKDDVESVTIVEKSQEIIDIFNQAILPQFKTKDKINIVHADMFEYVKEHDIEKEFDYAFVDIWQDCTQVYLYLKCRKALENVKNIKVDYWISKALDNVILDELIFSYMEFVIEGHPRGVLKGVDNPLELSRLIFSIFKDMDTDSLTLEDDFSNVEGIDKFMSKLLEKM